jgi:hypothetical protein
MIIPHPKKHGLVVKCDYCGVLANYIRTDAGDAAEMARKQGFKLRPGASLTDPMKWSCGCK